MAASVISRLDTLVGHWKRSEIVSAAFVVCFLNGLASKVYNSIEMTGFYGATMALFGISVLVLICAFLVLDNLQASEPRAFEPSDGIFFGLVFASNVVPSSVMSWLALTALALREIWLRANDAHARRAGVLMLGAVMSIFWARMIFTLASNSILAGDAVLVSWFAGAPRVGNVVYLPNDSGFLWIADACSSFQNLSLAMLCWLMFTEYSGRPRNANDYWVCLLACLNVIVINVTRIALIARRPDLYDFVHGAYGAAIAGYLTTLVVLVICATGIKRDKPAAA